MWDYIDIFDEIFNKFLVNRVTVGICQYHVFVAMGEGVFLACEKAAGAAAVEFSFGDYHSEWTAYPPHNLNKPMFIRSRLRDKDDIEIMHGLLSQVIQVLFKDIVFSIKRDYD